MGRRIAPPFGLQRKEARRGELIERLIPAPAEIGDDARDQGVEIDFPRAGDASCVAL
jgi:hypothetical protein